MTKGDAGPEGESLGNMPDEINCFRVSHGDPDPPGLLRKHGTRPECRPDQYDYDHTNPHLSPPVANSAHEHAHTDSMRCLPRARVVRLLS